MSKAGSGLKVGHNRDTLNKVDFSGHLSQYSVIARLCKYGFQQRIEKIFPISKPKTDIANLLRMK